MSDDIVTRLRGQMQNQFVVEHPHLVRVPTLCEQAADEIERLRADLENALECLAYADFQYVGWERKAQKLLVSHGFIECPNGCKAVRGE